MGVPTAKWRSRLVDDKTTPIINPLSSGLPISEHCRKKFFFDRVALQVRPILRQRRQTYHVYVGLAQIRFALPENFAQDPANAIARVSSSQNFFGNRKTEPALTIEVQKKKKVGGRSPAIRTKFKIFFLEKPGGLRKSFGRYTVSDHFCPVVTVRRLRPLRRRRERTNRPSLRLMRFKKPCVRLRFTRLG